jgi:hypothetical protein
MILCRGDNEKQSQISLPHTYSEDYSEQGYGIYAFQETHAQKAMVYAVTQACNEDDPDPDPLDEGYLTFLQYTASPGERSLDECLVSECAPQLQAILTTLAATLPPKGMWIPIFNASPWVTVEDVMANLTENDWHVQELYKELCAHYKPLDPAAFLLLWEPIFEQLNSFHTLTENPGEVIIFSPARLQLKGHQHLDNIALEASCPVHPGYAADQLTRRAYVVQREQAKSVYLQAGHVTLNDPILSQQGQALKNAVDTLNEKYGDELLYLSLSQQQRVLQNALPEDFNLLFDEAETLSLLAQQIKPEIMVLQRAEQANPAFMPETPSISEHNPSNDQSHRRSR